MRLAQSTAATRPIADGAGIGVVVLHVVADRAVVDDVVQLDHAVLVARSRRSCSSAGMSGSIGVTT